jgi:succinate dehydrogenase/fumarate reductase flavoprotein subunit
MENVMKKNVCNKFLSFNADLLIIGGGSAGCMAAIRALELNPKLKIVIFEKGDIRYSGSIARGMDALNIVSIPNITTPELYVESINISCKGIADEPASYTLAKRSFNLLKKLESWGVYFPTDNEGNYKTLKYHVKGNFQTAMQEPNLKTIMADKIVKENVMIINRVMGIDLLMDDGRVAGAIGLNVRSGEMVVCNAKAVIVSAGGQARFSLPNSGYLYGVFDYPGNSGDGFVMSYRAGAGLTGMESTHRPLLIKDANMPLLAITVTRGGQVVDIFDNIIMENEVNNIDRMNKAHDNGFGPIRVKLRHLDESVISEIESILFTTERPSQERFFKQRGIDFRKSDIELWPTEHQICGGHGSSGVYVNEKAECGVPGLYVAGDVACVPKQHLSGALVFGEIAAEEAVKFITSHEEMPLVNEKPINEIMTKNQKRFDTKNKEIDIKEIEYKVRRFIGDYVVGIKNEDKLKRWLHWSQIFFSELTNNTKVKNGHELAKTYEIENIISCANFSATASLERKESRWGSSHYRSDYPKQDDDNCLYHIILKKSDINEDINVEKAAIKKLK